MKVLILLDRDCPLFQNTVEEGRGMARGGKERIKDACTTNAPLREVSTGPESDQEPGSKPSSKVDLRLPFMEVEALGGPPDTGILTGQFGTTQLEDSNL